MAGPIFPITTQARRRANLLKLMNNYHQSPEDYDHDVEEDVRPYLSGDAELSQFCCVTVHFYDDAKAFFLPCFTTSADACARAVEYARDDTFHEMPEAVVDLDNGDAFDPVEVWKWQKRKGPAF